jgi:hypothetical protein
MKENILVFDVESTSLLGNGFCFGAIVSDKEGKILDKLSLLSIESLDSCSDWVKENVLPNLDDITKVKTDILLREEFYKFYIKWKDTSDIWVDCGFPVETNFLNKVALDDLESREFNMPYPLYDLCNFVHPDIERENKGKKHNPIDDSIASLKYIIDGKLYFYNTLEIYGSIIN